MLKRYIARGMTAAQPLYCDYAIIRRGIPKPSPAALADRAADALLVRCYPRSAGSATSLPLIA